jgi:hypothetical protein
MIVRLIRWLGVLGLIGIGGFLVVTHPASFDAVRGRTINLAGQPNLDNGKTVFWAGGCASCHATENQDDKTRLGGGHALKSPFGTFHVPNISQHARDGIGGWTVQQFARAMVQGVSPDGRHYYPSFPYAASATTNCRSRSTSGSASAAGSGCSSTANRSRRRPANRLSSIAASTSRMARGIAGSATARATSWAASSPA